MNSTRDFIKTIEQGGSSDTKDKKCLEDEKPIELDDVEIQKILDDLGFTPSMYPDLTPSAVDELAELIPDPVPRSKTGGGVGRFQANDDHLKLYDFASS